MPAERAHGQKEDSEVDETGSNRDETSSTSGAVRPTTRASPERRLVRRVLANPIARRVAAILVVVVILAAVTALGGEVEDKQRLLRVALKLVQTLAATTAINDTASLYEPSSSS